MNLPRILLKGSYSPNSIEIVFSDTTQRKINSNLEKKMRRAWQEALAKARKEGKKVWESELYRLDSFKVLGNKLTLNTSAITYGIARSANDCWPELEKLGEDYFPKCLFVSGVVETADNKYVLGELSQKYLTTSPRKIDLIGGVVSKTEGEVKTGQDLYKILFNEFEEEMNLARNQVKNCVLRGAIISDKGRVGLIFKALLSIDSRCLQKQFEQSDNDEMDSLLFFEENEFFNKLNEIGSFRIKVAELLK